MNKGQGKEQEQERLTIGECAARAGIGRTTAKRSCADFYIHPVAGGRRFRLYDIKTVDRFVRIRDLYRSGVDHCRNSKSL